MRIASTMKRKIGLRAMNKEYNIKSLLDEHIIIVPEMQRDYVWSVTTDNVYKLLKVIDEANGDKINIGFIYACQHDGLFYLVDGQQRITTLVLLAFYLSLRNNGENWPAFQQMIVLNKNLRFTYRVRKAVENFMKDLFLSDKCLSFNDIRALSAQKWDNDTTVENMIETLHIIDRYIQMNIFSGNNDTLDFGVVIQNVTFYYTDIKQTAQGRDIYITMNSCGQPLAKHERLKPYLIAGEDILSKSIDWNTWEDWFYRLTKASNLDKSAVDIAMGNFLRIVYELKTAKPVSPYWETAAESMLSYGDVHIYFEALKRLYEFYPEVVAEIFTPSKTKEKTLYFRVPKALLQVSCLNPSDLSNELKRMKHLVDMCLRGKTMKDGDLLLFLRRYKDSHLDLYTFVNANVEDSLVTSCLHQHEIRKIQFIQNGTGETERLFLKAESLDLYNSKDYYCLLNALWDEKFSGDSLGWSEQDDIEFNKRIDVFNFLFKNKWKELKHKHEDGVIDNAFLARYLLSLEEYDYYRQDREYRILGRDGTWREMLIDKISCRRISCMIGKLYNVDFVDMYSVMSEQIKTVWQTYPGAHDSRYYILKYPDSLRARSNGWNKLWVESIWGNRLSWKSYNIAIYSAPQNWKGETGTWMFESLLAHASKQNLNDEWYPKLSNGICLKNGRDRHGWRITYGKNFSRDAITKYLQDLADRNPQILSISPAKDADDFVFVDIINDYDLIEGGVLLLNYLNDCPNNTIK